MAQAGKTGLLEVIKNELLQQKENLIRKNIDNLRTFKISPDISGDEYDQAQVDVIEDINVKLNNRDVSLLEKINNALDRFMDDSYGLCTECGDVIPLKRLQIEPTTDLCVDCKENEEKTDRILENGPKTTFKYVSNF